MKKVVEILRKGGIVVFPTETAYGLGCDATNAAAVRRIYHIKGRERGKPLPVIAADIRQVKKFFHLDGSALRLAKQHWPGPFTIILPARDSRLRRAVGRTVGVRVSSNRVARALAAGLGRPIVATSANRSGGKTCYSVSSIRRQLPLASIDGVIDIGTLPRRKPSTIIRIEHGNVIILRRGPAVSTL